MKKIVLQGDKNVGKSTTIKGFIHLLLSNNARLITSSSNFRRLIQKFSKVGEVWAIFEINDKIIFVTTYGDCRALLENALSTALELSNLQMEDIDIIVCACHPKGNAKRYIESIEGEDPVYIYKSLVEEKDRIPQNIADANSMLKELLSMV